MKKASSHSRTRPAAAQEPRNSPRAGTVTGIELQRRSRADRVNIRIDGDFAFSLSADAGFALHVGQDLDDTQVRELLNRDAGQRAYLRAVRFLAARPRSTAEVRRRLRASGIEDEPAALTIERLGQEGLLDDAQFATYWVGQRQAFRPRGPRALRYELRSRGVSPEAMTPAIAAAADEQEEGAYRAALREARRQGSASEHDFTLALRTYLARRGFDFSVSRKAVSRLWLLVNTEASAPEP